MTIQPQRVHLKDPCTLTFTNSFTHRCNLKYPYTLWAMGGNQRTWTPTEHTQKLHADSSSSSGLKQRQWSCEAATLPTAPLHAWRHLLLAIYTSLKVLGYSCTISNWVWLYICLYIDAISQFWVFQFSVLFSVQRIFYVNANYTDPADIRLKNTGVYVYFPKNGFHYMQVWFSP